MSMFSVPVVKIEGFGKVPESDNLSITQVEGTPVVFKTGDFSAGDLAVYIPMDAVLPLTDPRFAFLQKPGKTKTTHRLKAVRLRGKYSEGLLIKPDPSWTLGQDVQDVLGITKYEEPEPLMMSAGNERDPGFMPVYDIEAYLKWRDLFVPGERVIVTEKIHGANSRFCWRDGRLWVGSHRCVKRLDESNMWWRVAREYDLETKLQLFPDIVFFGEVYGQVQDLKYGIKNGVKLVIFDAYSTKDRCYLDHDELAHVCGVADLAMVPLLYDGPYDREVVEPLRGGKTTIKGADNIREGFVIKPATERWNSHTHRTIFKYKSEEYNARQNGTEYH